MSKKRNLSLRDATEFVPDDLPDGAYWAMAHDISGAEYGEVWDELAPADLPSKKINNHVCPVCKKGFERDGRMRQHKADAHKTIKEITLTEATGGA
jgi:hypothetical protein